VLRRRGPNQLLLNTDATETAFKALPLENFRIVHLAVHSVANTEFPDRAALVLGTSPASPDDGILQIREIRDLPLQADLVVLSACETGSGRLLGEEGIASLERAFLLAGAKAVVASLWTADDLYTIALMRRFYQHLAAGSDKGTRCSRPDFIREAVIVQRDFFKSTSDQVAPRTSPERAAVSTANSSARAPIPSCERRRFMKEATSFSSTAAW